MSVDLMVRAQSLPLDCTRLTGAFLQETISSSEDTYEYISAASVRPFLLTSTTFDQCLVRV